MFVGEADGAVHLNARGDHDRSGVGGLGLGSAGVGLKIGVELGELGGFIDQ